MHCPLRSSRSTASKPHPEMGYRACLGIQSLAKAYSHPRRQRAAIPPRREDSSDPQGAIEKRSPLLRCELQGPVWHVIHLRPSLEVIDSPEEHHISQFLMDFTGSYGS